MKLRWIWIAAVTLFALGLATPTELYAQSKPAAKAAKKVKKAKKAKNIVLMLKLENLTKQTKPMEIKALRKALKQVEGVVKMTPMKKKGKLIIKHKPDADVAAIKEAVTKAGFTIIEPKPAGDEEAAADGMQPDEGAGTGTVEEDYGEE